jgi:ATP-dependent helicase HrpB
MKTEPSWSEAEASRSDESAAYAALACCYASTWTTDLLKHEYGAQVLSMSNGSRQVASTRSSSTHSTPSISASKTTRYEGLSISTRPAKPGRDPRSARVLFEAARKSSATALDLEQTDFASFTARVACLGQWMPELGLPDPDDVLLDELLLELCAGRISFEELRKAPLLDAFKARLDWEQLRALDKHAPEKIEIPSGSLITLAYERERPPVLAARIQELFGLSDSPTVAQGRVRVLLHLLAPNMRPQQVTDDLRNFWNTTYTEVRKELRQRYPKHDWPEDPWTASPRRGARRRR